MSNEFALALIPVITSLIGIVAAVLAAWISRKTAKSVELIRYETAKTVEHLRHELELERGHQESDKEKHELALKALMHAESALQVMKDKIDEVLMPEHRDCSEAYDLIEKGRAELVARYEERSVHLSEMERLPFHDAKSVSWGLQQVIARANRTHVGRSREISEYVKRRIRKARNELTELQEHLRKERRRRERAWEIRQ
jgi:uncharacterized membrane protein YccC